MGDCLLARSTAPKPVLAWVARQLVEMPNPLRDKLTAARHSTLWATLTGNFSVDSAATVRPGRLPLLALAPIVVAYEHQMTVPDTARYTWRQDRSGSVSRADAAAYLSLLAELGYLHADRAGDYRRCAVPRRRTHGRGTGVRPVGRRHGRQRPVAAPG